MPALRPVPDRPPRAVLYLRQSTHREESISIELQETSGRDYCARRGYEVVAVIKDAGVSGLKWEKRPGIQETLRMVKAAEAEKVVVMRWSRLSRQRLHQALALDAIEKAGGEVESSTEPFDTATAGGEFGRDVMLAAAAFESRQKSEQWRQAHDRRRGNGLPHNGTPRAGYVYESGAYWINPDDAERWREVYLKYIDGDGFPFLCKQLNRAGSRNLMSGKPWKITTLMRTMDSGFLAGLVIRDARTNPAYSKGAHDPVIDEELWELYLAARRSRKGKSNDVTPKYRLSGLVRCGDCAAAMVAGFGKGGPGYVFECGRWRRGEGGRYVSSVRTAIEDAVKEWLEDRIAASVSEAAEQVPAKPQVSNARAGRQIVARQINDLDKQLVTLTRQLTTGLVPESIYTQTRDEILAEREPLQAELDRLILEDRSPPVDVAGVASHLVEHWDALPVDKCRKLLGKLIRHVEVTPAEKKWGRPTFRVVPAWEPE